MANSAMTTMMPRTIQPDMQGSEQRQEKRGAATQSRRRYQPIAILPGPASLCRRKRPVRSIARTIDGVGAETRAAFASIGAGDAPLLGRVVALDVAGCGIHLRG